MICHNSTYLLIRTILEDAVKQAENFSNAGDTVVLSPACASFDLYKNFEERGNHFKSLVNKIVEDKEPLNT